MCSPRPSYLPSSVPRNAMFPNAKCHPNAMLKPTQCSRSDPKPLLYSVVWVLHHSLTESPLRSRMTYHLTSFSNISFASLTFVARYGLPPRSGWLFSMSCRCFLRSSSFVTPRSLCCIIRQLAFSTSPTRLKSVLHIFISFSTTAQTCPGNLMPQKDGK
jgi:hypothetical protein